MDEMHVAWLRNKEQAPLFSRSEMLRPRAGAATEEQRTCG
jgi:hypothetical protein